MRTGIWRLSNTPDFVVVRRMRLRPSPDRCQQPFGGRDTHRQQLLTDLGFQLKMTVALQRFHHIGQERHKTFRMPWPDSSCRDHTNQVEGAQTGR